MPPLNLLIKPASGSCNMRCRYCFYTDEAQKREVGSYGRMSRETAEILVDRETGVQYLFHCSGGYAAGLTPLLDQDGRPVVSP